MRFLAPPSLNAFQGSGDLDLGAAAWPFPTPIGKKRESRDATRCWICRCRAPIEAMRLFPRKTPTYFPQHHIP